MSEAMKDFAIKLFGKTICFPLDDNNKVVYDHITVSEQRHSSSEASSTSQGSKDLSGGSFTRSKHENDSSDPTDESLTEAATSSDISDDPNTPCLEKDSQEKTLKKPDKLLPCPRCNSMDTKFCYYNNYNVSQPRHFCKKCQRYWTAGGTMRNVPVGSGRRKNKNALVTNYDHVLVSDARADAINGPNCGPHEVYDPSGFPLMFYPSTPYWGCAIPSSWNGPWASLGQGPSPAPTFSILGKHPREGSMKEERPVLIPKTLRIHDPSDAAKSSIWSTLGIKNGTVGSTNGTSLFKAFGSKGDRNVSNVDNSKLVLHANPAALSRSLNFHETS